MCDKCFETGDVVQVGNLVGVVIQGVNDDLEPPYAGYVVIEDQRGIARMFHVDRLVRRS